MPLYSFQFPHDFLVISNIKWQLSLYNAEMHFKMITFSLCFSTKLLVEWIETEMKSDALFLNLVNTSNNCIFEKKSLHWGTVIKLLIRCERSEHLLIWEPTMVKSLVYTKIQQGFLSQKIKNNSGSSFLASGYWFLQDFLSQK